MTNAAAVIGLTYDGTDIQQNPIGIFLEIVRGLAEGPTVRGSDTVVPGLTGRIARNRTADVWTIDLEGWVAGTGVDEDAQRSDFVTLRATLGTLFDPTRAPADLVATLEDGSTLTIVARPLPTPLWGQQVPSMAKIAYQLEAVSDWVVGGS
jgi:hypothetical protein